MSTLRLLAALSLLAVIVAGCGNGPAGTGTSTPASAASGSTAARQEAVRFAECMRANGVSGFPDPPATGSFTIDGVVNGSTLDPNSASWKRAISACKHLQPPGFAGSKVTPEQAVARLEFAQCVRDNGVADFPDPAANGPIIDTNDIPSAATAAGRSVLDAAIAKCGALYSGEMGVTRQR